MVCTIDMDMNAATAMSLCSVLSEFSYDVLEKFNVGIIERRCYKFDSVFIKRLDCIIVSYWCNR